MDLLSFAILFFIALAVSKTWKRILRWWHRKKFCKSNRALCRALITAGFPDFKEYLYFKEDSSPSQELKYKYGCIDFSRSEMSNEDKENILKVVKKYHRYCSTDTDKDSAIIRIYLL